MHKIFCSNSYFVTQKRWSQSWGMPSWRSLSNISTIRKYLNQTFTSAGFPCFLGIYTLRSFIVEQFVDKVCLSYKLCPLLFSSFPFGFCKSWNHSSISLSQFYCHCFSFQCMPLWEVGYCSLALKIFVACSDGH